MDTTFIPIAQLDAAGLSRLANLHSTVMHTLLAELGTPMVLRYYEIAQTEPSTLGLCSMSRSGEIAAWAMGSPAPSALNARLRKPMGWFAGQMLRIAIHRPLVLINLIRSLLTVSDTNLLQPGQIELTYIGVEARSQGKGLGKAMLNAFSETASQKGYTSIALSVETDNLAACSLYTNYGFKIVQTFREGRFERHRMAYQLR